MSSPYSTIPKRATLPLTPFRALVPEERLQDFKTLLTLSPVAPAVYENTHTGRSYGVTRSWLETAKDHWLNDFDWRACEKRINSFPNFTAAVQDAENNTINLHFLALFSEREDAVPLALFHGWPGSPLEFLDILDLLRAKYTPQELPYHIIVPSLPGYAYSSGPPLETDYSVPLAASALHNLMLGLGFGASGYLVQGGDLGSFICRYLAANYEACKGMHVNMMVPPAGFEKGETEAEVRCLEKLRRFTMEDGYAFALEQGTRPGTVGLVVGSSPLALLGWIGEKFLEWSDEDPPLDKILESVTLYWMTDTMARCMYHSRGMLKGLKEPFISKPTGYSLFAHEIVPLPQSVASKCCNLVLFREHGRGGHFAAMERPGELLGDVEEFVGQVWKGT